MGLKSRINRLEKFNVHRSSYLYQIFALYSLAIILRKIDTICVMYHNSIRYKGM